MSTHIPTEIAQNESSIGEPSDTEMQVSSVSDPFESNIGESIDTEMSVSNPSDNDDCPEFDLGRWVGKTSGLSTAEKSEILARCWEPPEGYNFHADSNDSTRCFLYNWLTQYDPWLKYSKKLKGALCLHCVLFPPTLIKGVLGGFMVNAFTKYKDMHERCKNHASSQWHRASTQAAKDFTQSVPVDVMMVSGHQKLIEENRKIIASIIRTIIFCGTHDMALRGKDLLAGEFFLNLFINGLSDNIARMNYSLL